MVTSSSDEVGWMATHESNWACHKEKKNQGGGVGQVEVEDEGEGRRRVREGKRRVREGKRRGKWKEKEKERGERGTKRTELSHLGSTHLHRNTKTLQHLIAAKANHVKPHDLCTNRVRECVCVDKKQAS